MIKKLGRAWHEGSDMLFVHVGRIVMNVQMLRSGGVADDVLWPCHCNCVGGAF